MANRNFTQGVRVWCVVYTYVVRAYSGEKAIRLWILLRYLPKCRVVFVVMNFNSQ